MSNFWFNEDAFLLNQAQSNDNDFLGSIFDGLPPQTPGANPQQNQQQPQMNKALQTPGPLLADNMYPSQDLSQFGAMPQQNHATPSMEGKNPQMFMRPQLESVNSMPKHMDPSQHMGTPKQQQQTLDQDKQEQLSKMRQQIMLQQMLQQKQQEKQPFPDKLQPQQQLQQQHQQSLQQQQQQRQQQLHQMQMQMQMQMQNDSMKQNDSMAVGMGANAGSPTMNSQQYPGLSKASTPQSLPGANPAARQLGMKPNVTQGRPGQMQGSGSPAFLGAPPTQTPGQVPGKPTSAQLAQLQHELFQATLNDFMARRGTPMTQLPVINNKRINLLVLQVLGRKMGGTAVVLKNLQMLSQPTPQFTDWSTICQKMGLFEGVDVQSNPAAKQQIEKQLGTCYLQYILPYEQYILTEEGQKDIQARRLQFQRQLVMKLQQQLKQQQVKQPLGDSLKQLPMQLNQSQQQQPQMRPNVQSPMQAQPPMSSQPTPGPRHPSDAASGAKQGQFQSPSIPSQSPQYGFMPTPHVANMPSPSVSVANSQRKFSQNSVSVNTPPNHTQSPQIPSQQPGSRSSVSQLRSSSAQLQGQSESSFEQKPSDGKPNSIKKYVPFKKEQDLYSELVLNSISNLGDEIELIKPVYLFAPELGSLNIQALIMSLKNYTERNPGEASSALNTLLVTTTDSNYNFSVADAPELLEALANLGQKILGQITGSKPQTKTDYVDVSFRKQDTIESIFAKYADKGMKGEDVVYVVDSLTGEIVEDDDSDIEVDGLFSPEAVNIDSDMMVDDDEGGEHIDRCALPDFMTALHDFKDENRYHFSKMQIKGALDELVYLVDNLITITMTLRNLSFADRSVETMCQHRGFKKLLFDIIRFIAIKPESFVFERKRLCLLKDCLLLLDRNASFMELDTMEQAFLAFLLLSSFGPPLDENENDSELKFRIPSASLNTHTYLPFSIDAFTKLLVREPRNRALFQAVFTGTLNILSSSHLSAGTVSVLTDDHHRTKSLMSAYFKHDEQAMRSGVLLTRVFKLFLSSIPYTVSGVEFTKFIQQRSSTVSQALFGAKLVIDLISMDDVNGNFTRMPCSWLTSNVQIVLFNFVKNTLLSITESVKFPRNVPEHRILSHTGIRCLILVNSLLANVVSLKEAYYAKELLNTEGFSDELDKLKNLFRVQPEEGFVLNTILTSSIDPDVAQEIVRLHTLMEKLA